MFLFIFNFSKINSFSSVFLDDGKEWLLNELLHLESTLIKRFIVFQVT